MGTRADFYVGRGKEAEWLGSIAWDGYPDGIVAGILKAKTEASFRKNVEKFIAGREDGTRPGMGWPWPWEDSNTTDYAYAFDGKKVYGSCFGHKWFSCSPLREPEDDDSPQGQDFPNMKSVQKVNLGERSGVIII